jgi:hypothetical protein
MKAEHIELQFSLAIDNNHVIGSYTPGMGYSTVLTIGGEAMHDDGEGELSAPIPQRGETFDLALPSGCFQGAVIYRSHLSPLLYKVTVRGVWSGTYGGLVGGLSAFGAFELLSSNFILTTSWSGHPITWRQYQALRAIRNNFLDGEGTAAVAAMEKKERYWKEQADEIHGQGDGAGPVSVETEKC